MANVKAKTGKRRTLNGAVLIMVITVMFVLMLMLAGAMSIASTASTRVSSQYQGSQAYYTARSGVNAFVDILMNDGSIRDKQVVNQVNSNGPTGSETINMSLQNDGDNKEANNQIADNSGFMTQGRVLQEAFFGKLLTDDTTGEKYYDLSQSLYPYDGKKDIEYDKYEIDASGEVKITEGFKDKVQNNDPSRPNDDNDINRSWISFDAKSLIDFADVDGEKKGLLADSFDGAVYIEAQLKSLEYNVEGGTFNRMQIHTSTDKSKMRTPALLGEEADGYINCYEILVTCTAQYEDEKVTVSRLLVKPKTPVEKTSGFVSVASSAAEKGSFYGGTVIAGDFTWNNNSAVYDNVMITGNAFLGTDKTFYLGNSQSMYFGGDLVAQNGIDVCPMPLNEDLTEENAPYVFVRGMLKSTMGDSYIGYFKAPSGGSRKKGDKPVDVICGGLSMHKPLRIYGDTYVDGPLIFTDGGGMSLNPLEPIFDGDLYVSGKSYFEEQIDGSLKEYVSAFDNFPKLVAEGTNTEYNNAVTGEIDFTKIVTNGGLFEKILKDINVNKGLSFCTGDIYFYYSEINANNNNWIDYRPGLEEYDGCVTLGMLYRILLDAMAKIEAGSVPQYGNATMNAKANIQEFLNRMHPIGYDKSSEAAIAAAANALYGGDKEAGIDDNYDMMVNNIRNLVALPACGFAESAQPFRKYVAPNIIVEEKSGSYNYKLFEEKADMDLAREESKLAETFDVNITIPKDPYNTVTKRWVKLQDRVSETELKSEDTSFDHGKVLRVSTLFSKFYPYVSVYDGEMEDVDKKATDIGDFIDGDSEDYQFDSTAVGDIHEFKRDSEAKIKAVSPFDAFTDGDGKIVYTASPIDGQTWDRYYGQILDAYYMYLKYSDSTARKQFEASDFAYTLLEVFNALYAYDHVNNEYFQPSNYNNFEGSPKMDSCERYKMNLSFNTIDEMFKIDMGGTELDREGRTPYVWNKGDNLITAAELDNGVLYLNAKKGEHKYYEGNLIVDSSTFAAIVFDGEGAIHEFRNGVNIINSDFLQDLSPTGNIGDTWQGHLIGGAETINMDVESSLLSKYKRAKPNMKWYIDSGTEVRLHGGSVTVATTYGPMAKFRVDANNRTQQNFIYHGHSINGVQLQLIGNLFVGAAHLDNVFSILYEQGGGTMSVTGPIVKNNTAKYGGAGMKIYKS